jgi:hypothetical protein
MLSFLLELLHKQQQKYGFLNLCKIVPKCCSAEFQISKKSPRIECHNKIGKSLLKSDFKKKVFLRLHELSYKDSENHIFIVVCEVILIENLTSAKSGPHIRSYPQFSPCPLRRNKNLGTRVLFTCDTDFHDLVELHFSSINLII